MEKVTGFVFNIQRYAVHDGPGIRTTVFLMGCPLRCVWCQNPESFKRKQELFFDQSRCILCRRCAEVCEPNVHIIQNERHELIRKRCNYCGKCAEQCCTGALKMVAEEMTIEQVLQEVEKDQPFYENSGGGITLSGGEPLIQKEFSEELLKLCGERQLHRVLQTTGYVLWKDLEEVLRFVDLLFFDIKEMDPAKHKEFTGVSNRKILENLRKTSQLGLPISIRVPVVPGYNDKKENFQQMSLFLSKLDNIKEIKLLPYNQLAESKYVLLGKDYNLKGLKPPEKEKMETLGQILLKQGLPVKCAMFSRKYG